ncbi:MAG: hypothetical protein D6824_07375 [Planctomycetota bacterium]|nr:MAG: hypothetical protein D6824_07375 [Planctomycetota bacterium]
MEERVGAETLAKAETLARQGQVVRVAVERGEAAVTIRPRGRGAQEFVITARPVLSSQMWRRAIDRLAGEAIYAAALQVGRIPTSVDDAFAPLGARLFPAAAEDLVVEGPESEQWGPLRCWAVRALAERIAREPLSLFTWRGMEGEAVVEAVRRRRAAALGRGQGAQPAYLQAPPSPEAGATSGFWRPGRSVETLDLTPKPAATSHPLLRRLGPSPFRDGRFPMLGLLATCCSAFAAAEAPGCDAGGDDGCRQGPEPSARSD